MDVNPDLPNAQTEVSIALRRLSEAWRNRRYDELRDCFRESAVMALPGFLGRVAGREAIVEAYREFMDRSTLESYSEAPATIEAFEHTAITYYAWQMVWTSGGKQQQAAGHDLFIFERDDGSGRWKAMWRTMLVTQGS
jgi:hypothetical protein